MDFIRELRRAMDTGNVVFGSDRALKGLQDNEAKMIILASNCPESIYEDIVENINSSDALIYEYEGTNSELGENLGKPFSVATIMIKDPGDSNIINFAEGGNK